MITVQYKKGDEWVDEDKKFTTLDIAKAHTIKEGYAEYKAWNGETLLAHLFNDVKPAPKPKKKKLEEPTPVVEHVDVEPDTPSEEE